MPLSAATNYQQLTERLLGHLRHEESLLHTSRDCLLGVHHALRSGDLGALKTAEPQQQQLADELREASRRRADVAAEMAAALGLRADSLSLLEMADRLPPALARQLRDLRDRLRAAVGQVVELQRANANLVQTLRSYFRGVLSGLAPADVPTTRYGPTGGRLQPVG